MTPLQAQLASAAIVAGCGALGIGAYGYLMARSRLFLPVISRGADSSAAVALTFDDGPGPLGTGPILDILRRNEIKAAFFVIGSNAAKYPELIRRMHDEGHLICNHTYDHWRTGALRSGAFWNSQLRCTDEVIERIIGKRPALFRPPMGHKSPWMRRPLRESGHLCVCWSRRGLDGISTTPAKIVKRLVPKARAGDILLLHDGREAWSSRDPGPTIAAMEPLIAGIRAKGLRFVRLDHLIGRDGYSATRTALASASCEKGSPAAVEAMS